MSTLYLVRHGQASFGQPVYDRLSPLGRRQAALLREHLVATGELPDALYSGSLDRQRHTAHILAGGLDHEPIEASDPPVRRADMPVTPLTAFDEYPAGRLIRAHALDTGARLPPLDGVTPIDPRAYQRRLEEVGLLWAEDRLQAEGTESWRDFQGRVAAGLEEVMAREGRSRRVIVSTSAGVIGAAIGHLLGLPPREAIKLSWSVHNSSVSRIQFDGERTSLLSFNAAPHLEHPQRRALLTFR